jgi:hypothetical protein
MAPSKVIDELKSLCNVLESLEQLSRNGDDTEPATTSRLGTIKVLCDTENCPIAKELKYLDEKLRPQIGRVGIGRDEKLLCSRRFGR